jgi:hypothetical protein
VVVVAAGGNESGLRSVALRQVKAEYTAIKMERPFEVGDLEVHMADTRAWINGSVRCFFW